MLKNWLIDVKHYYVDAADPEGSVFKLSCRTALACIICILLLQFIGNLALSAWAGFAAFAFVQNDTQDVFFNRLRFFLAVVIIFTGITLLGMLLGNNLALFLVSVPIIIFVCAFPACLGFSFFNTGAWALFLYILAGAKPTTWTQAGQIAGTFLLCGVISICIAFFVFPIRPYRKIMLSYERILTKILLLFRHAPRRNKQYLIKFNAQLDNMLELQEKNINLYLEPTKLSPAKHTALINLAKLLWQIGLMTKSTVEMHRRISNYSSYLTTKLEQCSLLIEELLMELIIQIKQGTLPNLEKKKQKLMSYRDSLTHIRKQELAKDNPNFSEFFDYSGYFYHFIKLLALLEEFSQNISQLKGKS